VEIDLTIQHEFPEPLAMNQTVGEPTSDSGISKSDFAKIGAMLNAASYCVFDYAPGWQGCVSTGFYDDAVGYNTMLATRIDNWMVRFGVQADEGFDEFSGGVGGSWHF
jgi:hypothetical protein